MVYVTSHNQPPNNAIQCARNFVFIHKFSKKKSLPWEGETASHTHPPLGHFALLLWPPLIGVKEILKRGNIYGIGTYATSHNYPLIMSFSVEENAVFIDEFSKKISLPWEGGHPPPTPSPPPPPSLAPLARAWSLRSLAYYRPPKIKSWLRHWFGLTIFGHYFLNFKCLMNNLFLNFLQVISMLY